MCTIVRNGPWNQSKLVHPVKCLEVTNIKKYSQIDYLLLLQTSVQNIISSAVEPTTVATYLTGTFLILTMFCSYQYFPLFAEVYSYRILYNKALINEVNYTLLNKRHLYFTL